MKANHKNIKTIYVFSDDKNEGINLSNFIQKIDKDFVVYFIQDHFYIDWTCLHLAKNIITSNSSFCATACIYDKKICYQPAKYQLRNTPIEGTYPCEPFFKNSYII
jgi:hypothetical protein